MKIFCVGRNYAAHAKELKNDIPENPVIFMKPKNALLLPAEDFYIPDFTKNLQYECEVVLKMGKNGKGIKKEFVHRYYDEISLGIDFTARDLQSRLKSSGHPWEIAKSFDDSAVLGSMIPVSAFDNLSDIHFKLLKNGEVVQQGHTADMLFSFDEIVSYISTFFTLNTGDLIYTGTPAGVGQVQIGDRLEGFIASEKMFEVDIK